MFEHKLGIVPDFYVDLLNNFETKVLPYDRGPCDYTTTSLSRGPLEAALVREYPDIPKEALDGVASIDGTMLHWGLEHAAMVRGDRSEVRRFVDLQLPDGKTMVFSGCNDYETGNSSLGNVMVDWKRTGAFAVVWGSKPGKTSMLVDGAYYKADWVWQLNINRVLASLDESYEYDPGFLADWKDRFKLAFERPPTSADYEHSFFTSKRIPNKKFIPERMFIGAHLKDWDRRRALRERDYPNIPVVFVEMPFLPNDMVWDYIQERIDYHEQWKNKASTDVPVCSDKERWKDDDVWKVFDSTSRAQAPRSKGNVDSVREAEELAASEQSRTGKAHRVESFPGAYRKCMRYCDVRYVCPIGRELAEPEPWEKHARGADVYDEREE